MVRHYNMGVSSLFLLKNSEKPRDSMHLLGGPTVAESPRFHSLDKNAFYTQRMKLLFRDGLWQDGYRVGNALWRKVPLESAPEAFLLY